MISFIIIGRNEGWKLSNCVKSIYLTIKYNCLTNYEVIYVDSKSTDDSIERVKEFKEVKVFQISGICNAAIARNIGAKESVGEFLFFIDGDMEIQPEFLKLVYEEHIGLKNEFVSGKWIDYNYTNVGKLISKKDCKIDKFSNNFKPAGGLFLISRDLWFKVNGMKTKYRRSQDFDFGLRLAEKKYFLLRREELLAIHHTVPYNDKNRMWKLLFSGSLLYLSVILRENILNRYAWELFIRINYTLFILLFLILLSVILNNIYIVLIYFFAVLVRTIARKEINIRHIVTNLFYLPLLDIHMFLGFVFFWPRNHNIEYIRVK